MTQIPTQPKRMTAAQDWKQRMIDAKNDRPPGVGKQAIIVKVVEYNPDLDRLTLATRWHNAWNANTADPELTLLVEKAVKYFNEKHNATRNRLSRQKLKSA